MAFAFRFLCRAVTGAVLCAAILVSPIAADEKLRTVTWSCDDAGGLVTTFLEGEPPTVRIDLGDSHWTLPLVPSDSGSKYSDGTVTLWTHGNEASFDMPGRSTRCVFVDPAVNTSEGLEGSSWRLVALVRDGVRSEPPSGNPMTASFAGGRVTGRGVCNRYFASYTVGDAGALKIGDVGATKMMCSRDYSLEAAFFASLRDSTRFDIGGDTLTLTTPSGSLTFTKAG